jgi:hypothetical protein
VERPVPKVVWWLGGASLATAGAGLAFGLVANSKESEALSGPSACAPNCSDARVSSIRTWALAADVSFGAALISGAVAGYWYWKRPEVTVGATSPSAATTPALLVSQHDLLLGWKGTF